MNSRDYLAHHGVKGMRWGVRRQRGLIGKPKSRSKHDSVEVKKDKERLSKMNETLNRMDVDPSVNKKTLYKTAQKMASEIRTDPKSMKKARTLVNNIYGEYELYITGVYDDDKWYEDF